MIDQAERSFKQGKVQGGLDLYQKALNLSGEGGNHAQRAEILIQLGRLYGFTGDIETSRKYLTEGMELATDMGDQDLEAEALICIAAFMVGQQDRAEEILTRAVATARKGSSTRVVASALNALAATELKLGKTDDAERNVGEALRISDVNHYTDLRPFIRLTKIQLDWARNRMNDAEREITRIQTVDDIAANPLADLLSSLVLARLYSQKGDWQRATPLFEKCQLTARRLHLKLLEAGVQESLALAYEATGNYIRAIDQWSQLVDPDPKSEPNVIIAEAHFHLGLLYEKQRNLSSAILHLEAAKDAYRALHSPNSQGVVLITLARLYEQGNDNVALLSVAENGVTIASELKNKRWEFLAYATKGSALRKLGQTQQVVNALEQARTAFLAIQDPSDDDKRICVKVYFSLASAYTAGQNGPKAVSAAESAICLARDINDQETVRKGLELLAAVFNPEWLRAVDSFYAQGKLEDAAGGYALEAIYFELASKIEERSGAIARLQEICNKWSSTAEVKKFEALKLFVSGSNTLSEFVVLSGLISAYKAAGNARSAENVSPELERVVTTKKSTPEGMALQCLFDMVGSLSPALDVDLAKNCKDSVASLSDKGILLGAKANLFRALVRNGQPDEADAVLSEIVRGGADVRQALGLHVQLAWSFWRAGEIGKARSQMNEAAVLADRGGGEEAADIYTELGALSALLPESGPEALRYLRFAETYYSKAKQVPKQVRTFLAFSDAYWNTGETGKALEAAKHAQRLAESLGENTDLNAEALLKLGLVSSSLGQRQESIRSYEKAFSIYRRTHSDYGQQVAEERLVWGYSEQGDRDKALEAGLKALSLAGGVKSEQYREALEVVGDLYGAWGEYQSCIEYHQRALKSAVASHDVNGQSTILARLSDALLKAGDSERAAEYGERARALTTSQSRRDRITTTLQLAFIYGDRRSTVRDPAKAEKLYQEALAGPNPPGCRT